MGSYRWTDDSSRGWRDEVGNRKQIPPVSLRSRVGMTPAKAANMQIGDMAVTTAGGKKS